MKRVLTAVVLIPLVLLVVFKAPVWLFTLVIAGVAALALREYLTLLEAYGFKALRRGTYFMSLVIVFGTWWASDPRLWGWLFSLQPLWLVQTWNILLMLSLFFGIPVVFRRDLHGSLLAAAGSAFGVLYIVAPLSLLIRFRSDWNFCALLIFILFSVWSGDIAAYYVGKTLGRHLLAPAVSPKKTWEGAFASVVASVAMAGIVFHFYARISGWFAAPPPGFYTPLGSALGQRISLVHVIILGLLANVAAQLGDLFESAIKRGAQVKDSGSILPGHGGILDRIDALLFAIPTVWYYAMLSQFLQPIAS